MSRNHHRLKGWDRFRRRLLDARGWRCSKCGLAGKLEINHKRPLQQGGAVFDEKNCEILCVPCHIAHHRPDPRPGVAAWRTLLDEIIRGD